MERSTSQRNIRAQLNPGEGEDAARVLSQNLSRLLRLRKDEAVINRVYFFPPFAEELCVQIPALRENGFDCTTQETMTQTGERVSAALRAPDGAELQLGAVLLTGTDVEIVEDLVRVQRVVNFVKDHTPPNGNADRDEENRRPDDQVEPPGMGDYDHAYPESDQWQWSVSDGTGWA